MFNVESKFRIVEETVTVPDPWGLGVSLVILRSDSRKHQAWLKAQRDKSPLLMAAGQKFTLRALQFARPGAAAPVVEDPDADPTDDYKQAFNDAASELVTSGKVDLNQILRGGSPESFDVCVHLLRDVPGLKDDAGKAVKFTEQVARQLMTSEVVIDEGYGAGLTLGEALQKFVAETSDQHAEARAVYLDGAEKNSDASSAGN